MPAKTKGDIEINTKGLGEWEAELDKLAGKVRGETAKALSLSVGLLCPDPLTDTITTADGRRYTRKQLVEAGIKLKKGEAMPPKPRMTEETVVIVVPMDKAEKVQLAASRLRGMIESRFTVLTNGLTELEYVFWKRGSAEKLMKMFPAFESQVVSVVQHDGMPMPMPTGGTGGGEAAEAEASDEAPEHAGGEAEGEAEVQAEAEAQDGGESGGEGEGEQEEGDEAGGDGDLPDPQEQEEQGENESEEKALEGKKQACHCPCCNMDWERNWQGEVLVFSKAKRRKKTRRREWAGGDIEVTRYDGCWRKGLGVRSVDSLVSKPEATAVIDHMPQEEDKDDMPF